MVVQKVDQQRAYSGRPSHIYFWSNTRGRGFSLHRIYPHRAAIFSYTSEPKILSWAKRFSS